MTCSLLLRRVCCQGTSASAGGLYPPVEDSAAAFRLSVDRSSHSQCRLRTGSRSGRRNPGSRCSRARWPAPSALGCVPARARCARSSQTTVSPPRREVRDRDLTVVRRRPISAEKSSELSLPPPARRAARGADRAAARPCRPAEVSWVTIVPVAASSAGLDTIQLPVDRRRERAASRKTRSAVVHADGGHGQRLGRRAGSSSGRPGSRRAARGPVPGRCAPVRYTTGAPATVERDACRGGSGSGTR